MNFIIFCTILMIIMPLMVVSTGMYLSRSLVVPFQINWLTISYLTQIIIHVLILLFYLTPEILVISSEHFYSLIRYTYLISFTYLVMFFSKYSYMFLNKSLEKSLILICHIFVFILMMLLIYTILGHNASSQEDGFFVEAIVTNNQIIAIFIFPVVVCFYLFYTYIFHWHLLKKEFRVLLVALNCVVILMSFNFLAPVSLTNEVLYGLFVFTNVLFDILLLKHLIFSRGRYLND